MSSFAVNLNGNRTIGSLIFSGTRGYTLSNSLLTVNSGSITVSAPVTGSVTHTMASALSYAANAVVDVGANATLLQSGSISGAGSLTKTGAGALFLSGSNTYANGTIVKQGMLVASAGASISHSTANLTLGNVSGDDGMLVISGGSVLNNQAVLGNQAGAHGLALVSSGSWQISNSLFAGYSGTGTVEVAGGGVSSVNGFIGANAGSLGVVNVSEGSWQNSGFIAVGYLGTGSLDISGGLVTSADGYIGLGASGSGTATVSGGIWQNSGTLTIGSGGEGSLDITGSGTVSAGSVVVAANSGADGALNIGTGGVAGTLDTAGVHGGSGTARVNFHHTNALTFAPNLTGTMTVTKAGAGTLTLTGSNTFTGTTLLSGGTLQLGNGGTTGSITGDIVNNATLVVNRSGPGYDYNGVISGTGRLTKTGPATLRLGGENTFTGGITISGGVLAVGTSGATGSIVSDIVNNAILIFNRSTDYTYGGSIGGGGSVYKVHTNTLTLSGSNTYAGTTHLEGGMLVFSSLSNLGVGGTIRFGGGGLQWAAGNTADISARTVFIDAGGATFDTNDNTVTLANAIGGGDGGLTKTGSGTLILAGNNTYAGLTTISDGTLQIGNDGNTGSVAGDILNNSALVFARKGSFTYSGDISGSGSVTKNSTSSMLNITGNLTHTGGTTVNQGEMYLQDGGSISGNIVNHASFGFDRSEDLTLAGDISGSGTLINYGTGTVTLTGDVSQDFLVPIFGQLVLKGETDILFDVFFAASGTVVVDGGSLTARGIDGSGALVVQGGGSVSADTLDGGSAIPVTLNNGSLAFTSSGSSGNPFGLGSGGGTLSVGTGLSQTLGGTISGAGRLTKTGGGTLVVGAANSYSNGTIVKSGTLEAVSGGSINHSSSNLTVGDASGDGGTLVISGGSVANNQGVVGNQGGATGVVLVSSGSWQIANTLFSGYSGTGTVEVSGGSITSINGFIGANAGSRGAVEVSGGMWQNSGFVAVGYLGTGSLDISGGLVSADDSYLGLSASGSGAATVSGGIWENSGALTIGSGGAGVLNITDDGTVSADSVILAANSSATGSLNLGTGGLAGTLDTASVHGGSGAAEIHFNHSNDMTFAAHLTGSMDVTKSGSGALTLSGSNTFTGETVLNAGTLRLETDSGLGGVTVNEGATLTGGGAILGLLTLRGDYAPGNSPASVEVENLVMTNTGELFLEIGGTMAGADYDQLVISGTADLAGTLTLTLIDGYTPEYGTVFTLFDGTILGTFDTLNFSLSQWDVSNLYTQGQVMAVPEPGTALLVGAFLAGVLLTRTPRQPQVAEGKAGRRQ